MNTIDGTTTVPRDAALPRATRSSHARTGWAIFVFGTLIAVLYAFVIYPRQGAIEAVIDLNGMGGLARRIASGEGFTLGFGPTLRRAPLYPTFAASLIWVFGNEGTPAQVFRPVLIAQCLMFGLTCVVSWTLGRKLFGPRTGVIAGLLCAVMPQCWRYVGMTEVETIMGLLIALMALTGLNLYRETNAKNAVWFGLVCAAATLTKAVALLYPIVFALILTVQWWRGRAINDPSGEPAADRPRGRKMHFPALPIGVAVGVFVLCLLPWCLRNYIVSGGQFKSVSSNGPGEFFRGYIMAQPKYALLKQDFGGNGPGEKWDWEANLREDELLRAHGASMFSLERFGPNGEPMQMEPRLDLELKKEKIESAEMKRRLTQEPLGFVKKFGIQLFTFWYVVETTKKSLAAGAIALVVLTTAFFGWWRARRRGIDTTPVISVVLYFNLMYAAILAFARYSMPVFPTLLVLAAFGVARLLPPRLRDTALSAGE
jgi:4-amino-4-deoxy-L-arabinose transferase-like glycosyltransferase